MRVGPLKYTHTAVVVGNTSTPLLAACTDRSRAYVLIQNVSSEKVDIKVGAAAVADEGIQIAPASTGIVTATGSFEMSEAKNNLSFDAINGITASGTKNVLVTVGS